MIELRIVGGRVSDVMEDMWRLLHGYVPEPVGSGGVVHAVPEEGVSSPTVMPASDNIGENAEPPEVANTAGKRRGRPPKVAEPETEVVFEKADVRKRVEQMIDAMQKAGSTQKEAFDAVRAKFDEFGATKLGDLDPAKYAAFMAATADYD